MEKENNATAKGNAFFTFLGWGIGGILVLTGLFSILAMSSQSSGKLGYFFMGLSMIFSGSVLIPPILRRLREKVPTLNKPFWPPILSFLVFLVFSIVASPYLPSPTPSPQAKTGATPSSGSKVGLVQLQPEAKNPEQIAELKSQLQALQEQTISIARECDQSFQRLSSGMENGRLNRFTAYDAAKRTEDSCQAAYFGYAELKPPSGLEGKEGEDLKNALQACELAYIDKQTAAGKIAKSLDRGITPSAVSEIRSLGERAQLGQLACIAGVMSVASAHGVDTSPKAKSK